MSALSVAVWIAGDVAAGARYSRTFIPIWNIAVLLAFYFVVVWLLSDLRGLQAELETRVQERTVALTEEMTERERLEKEILEVSEREQRRIGHDLHDSLCQHLTGTALAGRVLEEKLAAQLRPEAADARQIVDLVEEGIALARKLAHGLSPVEIETEGLEAALQELAAGIEHRSRILCDFSVDPHAILPQGPAATHVYRISQEAISNAIRHGKARHIVLSLVQLSGRTQLLIEDDGIGLPEQWHKTAGLGTRIMAHRAAMIGADFCVEPNPTGGTLVRCSLPVPAPVPDTEPAAPA
jgi:signal transduction histidine kinase